MLANGYAIELYLKIFGAIAGCLLASAIIYFLGGFIKQLIIDMYVHWVKTEEWTEEIDKNLEGRIGRYAGDSYTFIIEGQTKDERSIDNEKKGFCKIDFYSIKQIERRFSLSNIAGKIMFKRKLKKQANLTYRELDANIEFIIRKGSQLYFKNCREKTNYFGSAGVDLLTKDILVSNIECRQSLGSEKLTMDELVQILGKKFKIIKK